MNSLDKFMEDEWNEYISNNSGMSINDMMVNEARACDGECGDCMCSQHKHIKEDTALENEFISHPKTEAQNRKETPVYSGVLAYFRDAINDVARCSFAGQQQHAPDQPLQWHRDKSGDELDALTRHLLEAGTIDTDGIRHSAKVAWRSLANLQKELELAGEAPLSKHNNK